MFASAFYLKYLDFLCMWKHYFLWKIKLLLFKCVWRIILFFVCVKKSRNVLHRIFNHIYNCVEFSHSVVSDSLQPHEPQQARPPWPSLTPVVYRNPCLLSRWCHPTISSSVIPFAFCPQSFPTAGSFPKSQAFATGGQSIGV